ncbi:MAG: site-2 protease family protein [Candidatus Sumerlaeia bacterium]|nr:site-2 protease family protein [Candidatus Sumerlaeia bacterium]
MFGNESGLRVGKLFGIPVQLQWSWFFLFAFVAWMQARSLPERVEGLAAGSPVVWIAGAGLTLVFFLSLLAHEFGHALMARRYGIATERISLFLFGGVAQIGREPRTPGQEFMIAAAGPAISVALAAAFGAPGLALLLAERSPLFAELLVSAAFLNLALFLFNLLPGFPMDGGRMLRAAVWSATGDYLRATRIAARGGIAVAVGLMLLGAIGVAMGNTSSLFTIFIGWFLMRLAKSSGANAALYAAFDRVRAADLMRPVRVVVPPETTAREALELYFRPLGAVYELPVVDEDRLVGRLLREDIEALDPHRVDWLRAVELAVPYDRALSLAPATDGLTTFLAVKGSRAWGLPVFSGRTLVGMVRDRDLDRFLEARQAIRP